MDILSRQKEKKYTFVFLIKKRKLAKSFSFAMLY